MEGSSKAKEKVISDRTRRAWTDTEERILMDNLKELVKKNFKNENGFKPGNMKKLQEMMIKALPGTDIRATHHINSKITIWKRLYGSLRTTIGESGSGIGFNTTTCLLDCNDEQWAAAVARDPTDVHMRLKTWPMYEDWVEVFGNDRATGKTAENVYDSYSNLVNEDARRSQSQSTHESFGAQTDFNMETEDFFDVDEDSQTAEPETPPVMKTSQKKRSYTTSSPVDPLVDVLGKLVTTSSERLDNICRAIGFEADRTKARNDIFERLDSIPNLTLDQKIDVSKILAKDSNEMDMFLGFSHEAQVRYVYRLIYGMDFDDGVYCWCFQCLT